jgi:ABC-type transport system involved in multi-copper enzyme maturation permease subunit
MNGSFGRMLATEWRKVLTTKMLWGLILVALAFSCVNVVTLALVSGGIIPGVPQTEGGRMLLDPDYMTTLLAQVGAAATFVLILGVIAMTGEYRHMTITSTFLSSPRRGRVLAAKMALYGALGAVIAAITTAAVLATLLLTLAVTRLEHAPITLSAVGSVLLGALIGFTLYAILGVSLGALIKNQVAAIVAALVWILLVEAILGLLFPSASKWLPAGALNSAMDVAVSADPTGGLMPADRLPPWGGALVLLGYAVVFAVIASRTTMRRDIT